MGSGGSQADEGVLPSLLFLSWGNSRTLSTALPGRQHSCLDLLSIGLWAQSNSLVKMHRASQTFGAHSLPPPSRLSLAEHRAELGWK